MRVRFTLLLFIPLLFLFLALPGSASRGVSECVHFYVGVAQADGAPSPWLGQKLKGCSRIDLGS